MVRGLYPDVYRAIALLTLILNFVKIEDLAYHQPTTNLPINLPTQK